MRKITAILLCVALMLVSMPSTVASGAANWALPTEPEISPQWEYMDRCYVSLGIDGNGLATVNCSVTGITGTTTKIVIEAKLQRSWGLLWITEETFTAERNASYALFSDTCYVESGHSYRIKAKVTVYSGTDSESETIKSNVVEY